MTTTPQPQSRATSGPQPRATHPPAPLPEVSESAVDPRRRVRRDRRPSTPRGIECRWQRDRWRFRARRKVGRRARVGPWRDELDRALEDLAELGQTATAFRGTSTLTLGEAIEQAVHRARRRGVAERTLQRTYGVTGRFLTKLLGADTPLRELSDAERVASFLLEARRTHSAATAWRKDGWLLSLLLQNAGLPNPLPSLRREMQRAGAMKPAPPRRPRLRLDEIRELLARMRDGRLAPGRRTAPPPEERHADADLVELLAVTGARVGEFCRVTLSDVELGADGARVYLAEPKDRGHPRTCEVPERSRPALERQVARARELDTRHLVIGGEDALEALFARWRRRLAEPRLCGRVLRRSFLTACAQITDDMTLLMAAGGHRHASTTSKYVQAIDTGQRELAGRLGDALHAPDETDGAGPATTHDQVPDGSSPG